MIHDLPKRAGLAVLFMLASCSGSSNESVESSTSSPPVVSSVATTSSSTTTTIYYLYPLEFVAGFNRSCIEVGAGPAECSCVLDQAQTTMSFDDFESLVDGKELDFAAGPELMALISECQM